MAINSAVEVAVPKTRPSRQQKKKWMDKGTLQSVRKKHQTFRRWRQTRDGQDYIAYTRARNKAQRDCREAKKRLEINIATKAKCNPKAFWSYVKAKTSLRTGVSDLMKDDGTKTISDQEKAEVLNNFFQSVFTREDDSPLPQPPQYQFSEALKDIDITEGNVRMVLESMRPNKAAGPDGISPLILTKAADILARPLSILFQRSLELGQVPKDWKSAQVTPIFKKGSRLQASNYRPLSLTCVICKAMETLVRGQVLEHLQKNDLISRQQHGFVKGRSCITQLLEVLDAWTEIIDAGGSVDAI